MLPAADPNPSREAPHFFLRRAAWEGYALSRWALVGGWKHAAPSHAFCDDEWVSNRPGKMARNFAGRAGFTLPVKNSPDEQDDLWRLLGRAREPKASPFFARNILREVRGLRQEQPGVFGMLLRRWQMTLATAVAGCIAVGAAFHFLDGDLRERQVESLAAIVEQVSDSPDYFVINDLDDLLASEESSVWLDNSVH